MKILVLLDMYFDAAVVEVEKNSLLFRLALAMLCTYVLLRKDPTILQGIRIEHVPDFQKVPFVHHFSENFESKPAHIQAWRKFFKWLGQIYVAGVNYNLPPLIEIGFKLRLYLPVMKWNIS